MKLVYAIIRNDNEDEVTAALNKHQYFVTKLSTVGGFLRKGNITLLIVTEDDKVDDVIEIIREECGQSQDITVNMPYISGTGMMNNSTVPVKVKIGGATIFVTEVERFEKF